MGVALKDLVIKEETSIKAFNGKVLVIDAHNMLYQFLTTIRSPDGEALTNSKGRVTSHIIGLFSRLTKFIAAGIKPVFIFDGKAPELKKKERERRHELKMQAEAKYKIALEEKDSKSMKKYKSRTTRLTKNMIDDAKEFILALGIPIIEAPSEAEAQGAYMVSKGDAYACISQDYDALLFGCPRLIHNLTIAGRRKKIHGIGTTTVKPEIIDLAATLNKHGLDRDKLIALGMLVGTDYDIGGIKGIGPKTALKKVKEFDDMDKLFEEVKWNEYFDVSWQEVFHIFKKIPVTDDYCLKWGTLNREDIKKILVDTYEFSEERVDSSLERIKKYEESKKQKNLGDWF